jgi:hypothetical protein
MPSHLVSDSSSAVTPRNNDAALIKDVVLPIFNLCIDLILDENY